MDKNLNHSAWRKIENQWHKHLNDPDVESVYVDIVLSYNDPKALLRPTGFTVYYIVNRKNGKTAIVKDIDLENEPGQSIELAEVEK